MFDLLGQKVLVVVGKGGTGRTTLCRTLAAVGSKADKKVAVVAGTSGTHLSEPDDPNISFTSLEPGEVLISYLNDHGLGQLGKRLSSSGLATIISTAIPGIADLLVLAKIKQMEQSNDFDLIVFDAPASGHFLRLIATPIGLADIAAAGPLKKQSRDVIEMLNDSERLGVVLVTIAEETPVKETIETSNKLKEGSGIIPRALFVNSVLPPFSLKTSKASTSEPDSPLVRAAAYTKARSESQHEAVAFAQRELDLPLVTMPLIPTAELTDKDIGVLVESVRSQIRPLS